MSWTCKGNTHGGPPMFAHKLFRPYSIPKTQLKANDGVLLAPKSAQEHFTSMRTTMKMSTYGQPEDGHHHGERGEREWRGGERDRDRDKDRERRRERARSERRARGG